MEMFINCRIFRDLVFCYGHRISPNSSLRCCVFINIQGSRGVFLSFLLPGLAFNLQQQVGDPPDLANAGIFHSPHERRVL